MRTAVAPEGAPPWVEDAVRRGGGGLAPIDDAEALIWFGGAPSALEATLAHVDGIRWVQLSTAGIESFASLVDDRRIWTCAKGAFSQTVAEQAVALTLGLLRNLKVASTSRTWTHTEIRPLAGSNVLIVGGGGIGETLARHLVPFGVRTTVIRRDRAAVSWADRTTTMDELRSELATADVVYLAVPLSDGLDGLIGATELRAMKPTAILINVARGRHVVTDALVLALRDGWIAGAGLDVTDPEPLPDGHALWGLDTCIITSHSSNSAATYRTSLGDRIAANVERFRTGRELLGVVDPSKGY